jgi:uncharacterized protein
MVAQPFFLPTPGGLLFAQYHPSQGDVLKGRVLHLHPFAEELNTCRRLSAQAARAMAQAGFAVLQFDQRGCGDSEGQFEDASWSDWLEDAHHALDHLITRAPAPGGAVPLWLWGVRSGGLLATQLLQRWAEGATPPLGMPVNLLLWQPVLNGRQILQQWLRLHSAQGWLSQTTGAGGPEASDHPMQQLESGQTAYIGGYPISPTLAGQLMAAKAAPPAGRAGALLWLESEAQPDSTLSPQCTQQMALWQAAGWWAQAQSVASPGFWQQVGTQDAPAWVAASLAAMGLS